MRYCKITATDTMAVARKLGSSAAQMGFCAGRRLPSSLAAIHQKLWAFGFPYTCSGGLCADCNFKLGCVLDCRALNSLVQAIGLILISTRRQILCGWHVSRTRRLELVELEFILRLHPMPDILATGTLFAFPKLIGPPTDAFIFFIDHRREPNFRNYGWRGGPADAPLQI